MSGLPFGYLQLSGLNRDNSFCMRPGSLGFPGGSEGKASACNEGDLGLIPGLGRSPGEGNGNPLQYSCWKIPWMEEPGRLYSPWGCRVGRD